jgi:hypothetical protein
MARPKKPTQLKIVNGSAKHDPQRINRDEPDAQDLGDPPASLVGYELACWHEIVSHSWPGVIGKSDRLALELMARLVAIMRTDFENMNAAQINKLETLLARFGMTPSDRAKISVKKGKPKNGFGDL